MTVHDYDNDDDDKKTKKKLTLTSLKTQELMNEKLEYEKYKRKMDFEYKKTKREMKEYERRLRIMKLENELNIFPNKYPPAIINPLNAFGFD